MTVPTVGVGMGVAGSRSASDVMGGRRTLGSPLPTAKMHACGFVRYKEHNKGYGEQEHLRSEVSAPEGG